MIETKEKEIEKEELRCPECNGKLINNKCKFCGIEIFPKGTKE